MPQSKLFENRIFSKVLNEYYVWEDGYAVFGKVKYSPREIELLNEVSITQRQALHKIKKIFLGSKIIA